MTAYLMVKLPAKGADTNECQVELHDEESERVLKFQARLVDMETDLYWIQLGKSTRHDR